MLKAFSRAFFERVIIEAADELYVGLARQLADLRNHVRGDIYRTHRGLGR